MVGLDNLRIGNDFHNRCPLNLDGILEKNSKRVSIKSYNHHHENHTRAILKIYKENHSKENYPKKEKSKKAFLRLEFLHFKTLYRVRITNSLRKWYFGINSTQDFNSESLLDCLNILSEILGIHLEELLQYKIYRIELGITFKIDSDYKLLLQKLSSHRDFKKYGHFDNCSSVYFNGENIGVICYDVLQKMFDNNQISKNVYNKLSEKFFFLRLELKITKRAGVEFANKHMYNLKALLENSTDVLNYWVAQMLNIEVNEDISIEEIIMLKNLTPKDFVEFTSSKYAELITMQKMNAYIDLAIINNPKKKYAVKNAFKKNLEKWRVHNKTSNKEFLEQLILSKQKLIV